MILGSLIILGIIGLVAAVILYLAATRFKVEEDPRIAEIESLLPGANCGGCGLTGCHAFAVAVRGASSLAGLNCVVAGPEGMSLVAKAVGLDPGRGQRKVAVVHCAADCETRTVDNRYEGIGSCEVKHAAYQGETACTFGCLGEGDCVGACMFGAIVMDSRRGIPCIDTDWCTGCGMCASKCPRRIIEIRPWHSDRANAYVSCANTNRGPLAMKDCKVSCIGCMKCVRTCASGAVTVQDFLARIDPDKCSGCGACAEACPRHSIAVTSASNP